MTERDEISNLEVIRWKSFASISLDKFASLLRRQQDPNQLDENFAARIGDRLRELERSNIRIFFLLFSSILLIGAVNFGVIDSIAIFGIKLSKENATLGVLILFTSMLLFFYSAISLMSNYYQQLLKSYLNAKSSENLSEYFVLQFSWGLEPLFGGLIDKEQSLRVKSFVVIFLVLWIAAAIVAAIIIGTLQFYIFAGATWSILVFPKLPDYLNVPIVIVATCSMIFSAGCFLFRLPLPYSDSSNIKKIDEISKSDPALGEKIWQGIAEKSLERERRNVALLQLLTVLVFLTIPYVALLGQNFFSSYSVVFSVTLSLVIFQSTFPPILNRFERNRILSLKSFPDKSKRVLEYVKLKRRMLFLRLASSAIFGFLCFLYFQWRNFV